MRLGLIARADNTGLGNQTYQFYKHMKPDKTLVMDISDMNGYPVHLDRYPNAQVVKGILRAPDIDEFLADLDVIFVAEAPYNYYLYQRARELGVKTAVQYNYEFFDWFVHPDYPKPDMLIAPSKWNYGVIDEWATKNGVQHIYLHCPVDRDQLTIKPASQPLTFLHTAGRSASHDRNGTRTVIESAKYLQTDAKIVIHFQGEQGLAHQTTMTTDDYRRFAELHDVGKNNVHIVTEEFANYADVYGLGDVLLLPRRYGGNCLPLNEALSRTMPVIMTDIQPNNQLLPPEWLIQAEIVDQFTPRTTIDIYEGECIALASKIDRFYNMTSEQFDQQKDLANYTADTISWEALAPQYRATLEALCS